MKRFLSLLLALALLFLCACAPETTGPHTEADNPAPESTSGELAVPMNAVTYPAAPADFDAQQAYREDNAVTDEFRSALDAFAFSASAALLNNPKENANLSPLSLYMALALAAQGAGGETQTELLTLLGVSDAEALREQCGKLYRLLYTDDGIGKLLIANSLWMDDMVQGAPVTFSDAYLDAAAKDYYAELYQADFSSEAAGAAMGKWVSNHTGGVLSPTFPTDPQQVLSLLNTVYLYDEWTDRFFEDATKSGAFHGVNGDVSADFMNRTSLSGFVRGQGFTRASLGLKTLGRMVFILPDPGTELSSLLQDSQAVQALFTGGTESYGEVVWSVPKFRYGCKYDLAAALNALGVAQAFDPTAADFSGMTDTPVWLSKVTQQTHIAIDEKGVEATAYTEMGFAGAGMPQDRAEMILDRPFVYGILSREGTPLFIGVCMDPSQVS